MLATGGGQLVVQYGLRLDDGCVYIRIIWFDAWIGFRVEPLLVWTAHHDRVARSHIPVDFVMIRQNLVGGKRQVLADHQSQTVQQEEQPNEELILQPDHGAHPAHPTPSAQPTGRSSESGRR